MKIKIRAIERADAGRFEYAFAEQGWNKPASQFLMYYKEQQTGRRKVFVAVFEDEILGYVTLLPAAVEGPFKGLSIPEIKDFNVLKKYQGNGVGTKLIEAAEHEAFRMADSVSLAVGMHQGYGAAQRMYAKRGYIPDGSGLWYKDAQLPEMAETVNDDDLNLYLIKVLKPTAHN